jgi:hypothetical protein
MGKDKLLETLPIPGLSLGVDCFSFRVVVEHRMAWDASARRQQCYAGGPAMIAVTRRHQRIQPKVGVLKCKKHFHYSESAFFKE